MRAETIGEIELGTAHLAFQSTSARPTAWSNARYDRMSLSELPELHGTSPGQRSVRSTNKARAPAGRPTHPAALQNATTPTPASLDHSICVPNPGIEPPCRTV